MNEDEEEEGVEYGRKVREDGRGGEEESIGKEEGGEEEGWKKRRGEENEGDERNGKGRGDRLGREERIDQKNRKRRV